MPGFKHLFLKYRELVAKLPVVSPASVPALPPLLATSIDCNTKLYEAEYNETFADARRFLRFPRLSSSDSLPIVGHTYLGSLHESPDYDDIYIEYIDDSCPSLPRPRGHLVGSIHKSYKLCRAVGEGF